MTQATDVEGGFARALEALRPHLDSLIIVGGWAHRLYQHHPLAQPAEFTPLMTRDADFPAVGGRSRTGPILPDLRKHGFVERIRSLDTPPATEYVLTTDLGDVSLEFLVPLTGPASERNGAARKNVTVGGVTAQRLRYLDILAIEPWKLLLGPGLGFPVPGGAVTVRIANPVCYLMQKVLGLPGRLPRSKRANDIMYVHDTVRRFGGSLDQLREEATRILRTLPSSLVKRFRKTVSTQFETMTDLHRQAAEIAASVGRPGPPTPEQIGSVCLLGLDKVFGR